MTTANGAFHIGETWVFSGTIHNADGEIEDLTGATVRLRLARGKTIVFDLATPANGSIDEAANTYAFEISPAQQTAAALKAVPLTYEIRAVLPSGRVSTQNTGTILVLPSLF